MEVAYLERDLIAAMGLLAHNFLQFDPAIELGATTTHAYGFNVHALVVDNSDGEVLALARNRIFATEDPTQHAEQVAIDLALSEKKLKTQRTLGMTVDAYYKTQLFMAPGLAPEDFYSKGCTLYNTFDPCGFCAVTLLVCYMKRIAYLFEDEKFAAVYDHMKTNYFKGRDSQKSAVAGGLTSAHSSWTNHALELLNGLRTKVHDLEKNDQVPLVMTLDHCNEDLRVVANHFWNLSAADFRAEGAEKEKNVRMLVGLRRQLGGL